ncbi:MAG: hypothetical protein EOO78_25580 [Oxalobacteraceae bacterium]|nr:MAG: hypothetical protein EOO78_25580 [Oxalobacteraceae bacterium]
MRQIFGLSIFVLCGAMLGGCSKPEPLIDRINVSDAKYNRDIADCREQVSGGWIPFVGGSSADCMRGKGYHVLMNNSGL